MGPSQIRDGFANAICGMWCVSPNCLAGTIAAVVLVVVLGIGLVAGVLLDVPIYRATNRKFQRRGESLRERVLLLGHAGLALGMAGAVAAGIFLGQRDFARAAVAMILGMAVGASGNLVIQRERLRARRAKSASP